MAPGLLFLAPYPWAPCPWDPLIMAANAFSWQRGSNDPYEDPHADHEAMGTIRAKTSCDLSCAAGDHGKGEPVVLFIVVERKSEQAVEGRVQKREPGDL